MSSASAVCRDVGFRDYDLSARSGADAQGCGGPGTGGALQEPDELGRDACGKTRRELEAYLISHRAVGADLVHGVAVEAVVLDDMVVAGRVLAGTCDRQHVLLVGRAGPQRVRLRCAVSQGHRVGEV